MFDAVGERSAIALYIRRHGIIRHYKCFVYLFCGFLSRLPVISSWFLPVDLVSSRDGCRWQIHVGWTSSFLSMCNRWD